MVAIEGTFERRWSPTQRQAMSDADRYRIRLRRVRQDLGHAIDYLATRKDIDVGRLGWFGVSNGAQFMMPVAAVEHRFRAVVLDGGGIYLYDDVPAAEQYYNYLPRVTQPVLMLNGRWDIDVPLEHSVASTSCSARRPRTRNTSCSKRGTDSCHTTSSCGATLDWYDKYLGPTG